MPSQIVQTANGLFVWIDEAFANDSLGFVNKHLPPIAKDVPVFVFIQRDGNGDMETYFFDMRRWGYNVKFRGMNPGDARMIETLKLPTHDLEWPGRG